MAFLELEHVRKSFGATQVVKDFSLSAEKGEFITLLGPSGCGKTTVLRMTAGFETPTSGIIRIDGRDVTALRPQARGVGMVFQSYALFPNLTVAQNIAFGLKVQGVSRSDSDARVKEMLGLIGLPDLGGRYPFQLSGGQQQRVALARALAPRPRLLLLDEPLSALDAKIRVNLRGEIRRIQRELGLTTLFVTHDQEEALSMSDRVVVMSAGAIEQAGAPFEIYDRPATRFVAGFVGALNLFEGRVVDPAAGVVELGGARVGLAGAVAGASGGAVTLALRPEALRLLSQGEAARPGDVVLESQIEDVEFMGAVIRIRAQAAGSRVMLDMFNRPGEPPPAPGATARLAFPAGALRALGG